MAHVTVDPRRCEGAKDCIEVCPERVFAMRKPDPSLSLLLKLKVAVHGGKQAYAAKEEACTACMKCVDACPEKAIAVTP
jgi:NAD-dependent dihydropyrimidine dehydrogenase PreA subunit